MNREISRRILLGRLRSGSVSSWHRLGVVFVRGADEVVGSPARFDAAAAYLAPLWERAQPGLVHGRDVVELGIAVDGRVRTVGSIRVTPALSRRVREQAPRAARSLPGGPHPVRSRWPML